MTVPAGDGRALEALARYCLQSPVSLTRLRWVPGSETATYLPRDGHDDEKAETLNALDLITEGRVIRRILAHLGPSALGATQDRAPPLAAAPVRDSL